MVTGCITPSSVMKIGPDTYTISATATRNYALSKARQMAYESAGKHCELLGKQFMLVNENTVSSAEDRDTTINLTFRALDKDDPMYTRPEMRPDVVIEDQREK